MRTHLKSKLFVALTGFIFCFSAFSAEQITGELVSEGLISEEKVAVAKLTPLESLLPMLLGLAGILLVIFVLALLMKKITGLNIISNNIKVIESQSLGAKEKLVIVEIQQQQYVLGVTAHSINQICQLQKNIEKKAPLMPFDKIMKQFLHPDKSIKKQSGQNQPVTSPYNSSCEEK